MTKAIDWSNETTSEFQSEFLAWYRKERRNLPWRVNTDPYRVWISEIMLQQTRVDTVIDYYYRFMEKYPTVQALAEAKEEELLKVWEGLGYYSRARNLQAAAQQIMTEFSGEMPAEIAAIQSLKGIGPYTAGAIGSIAFQLPEPAIDGNVMRVVSRLFCLRDDISKASSRKTFDSVMRQIISQENPGDFNQALMDLGSAICSPTSPKCSECPIQSYCLAYEKQNQEAFPIKTKKLKPKDVYLVAGIIENSEGEILLTQREAKGLLANMWTFPIMEVPKAVYDELNTRWQKSNENQLELIAEEEAPIVFEERPIVWQKRHLDEVRHVFSHLKWHILPFFGRQLKTVLQENEKWVAPEDFSTYVFPKVQHKLVESWQKSIAETNISRQT